MTVNLAPPSPTERCVPASQGYPLAPMLNIYSGVVLEQAPTKQYARRLHFAELAPRSPLPSPRTLRRWKSDMGDSCRFSVAAPRASTMSLVNGEQDVASIEWLSAAAEAMDVAFVTVQSPSQLTTGQRHRDALARFFEALRVKTARPLVWCSGGLWEHDAAAQYAKRLGIDHAFDPRTDPTPSAETLYARVESSGASRRLSEGVFSSIIDTLTASPASEAYVTLIAEQALRYAAALHAVAEQRLTST